MSGSASDGGEPMAAERRSVAKVTLCLLLGYCVLFLVALDEIHDLQENHAPLLLLSDATDNMRPDSVATHLHHERTSPSASDVVAGRPLRTLQSVENEISAGANSLTNLASRVSDALHSSADELVNEVSQFVPEGALPLTADVVRFVDDSGSRAVQCLGQLRSQLAIPHGRRQFVAELSQRPAHVVSAVLVSFGAVWAAVLAALLLCYRILSMCELMHKQHQDQHEKEGLQKLKDASLLAGIDEQTHTLLLMEEGRLWVRQRIAGRQFTRSMLQLINVVLKTLSFGVISLRKVGHVTNLDQQAPSLNSSYGFPTKFDGYESMDFDPSFYEANPHLASPHNSSSFAASYYSW
mmetsp:Transcript_9013/g.19102  ORF Transcript_9013/g.19102 Transcript_9013/m.19102 type:complete len:351 (+) Transcript_9013:161-1213(+)|eukprot:CAMPEP_0185850312 /NCGR_PEP_ID=MMETSP1354-20130828/4493_1 /TAXON_ID=708628 /ORGANISM="Erythrolobus madagascarensis, Strain CCMP3276" /LENGTH=350 /DNA_ID=CAMNT_0028550979 /DNA_START=135 /DNA_END=1187 /DNA_ORIENTATION=-